MKNNNPIKRTISKTNKTLTQKNTKKYLLAKPNVYI